MRLIGLSDKKNLEIAALVVIILSALLVFLSAIQVRASWPWIRDDHSDELVVLRWMARGPSPLKMGIPIQVTSSTALLVAMESSSQGWLDLWGSLLMASRRARHWQTNVVYKGTFKQGFIKMRINGFTSPCYRTLISIALHFFKPFLGFIRVNIFFTFSGFWFATLLISGFALA